jgi:hypothetical protein
MAWSGGTYRKGNYGTNGWTGDASLGIGIEAGRHDTQDDDFMNGINQCLNKDGSNSATGNLNLGSSKITALANATNATDAMAYGQIRNGIPLYMDTANNRLGIGTSTPGTILDVQSTSSIINNTNYSTDTNGAYLLLNKSRTASVGTNTIVQSGDILGQINFRGANGTGYTPAAAISGEVDGTPGATNDMPGRLLFYTTPDGSGTLTERLRIDSAGLIQETGANPVFNLENTGTTPADGGVLRFGHNQTSSKPLAEIRGQLVDGSVATRAGDLAFFTSAQATGTLTQKMVIRQDGKIGIGVTSPSSYVQITNNVSNGVNTLNVQSNVAGDLATHPLLVTKRDSNSTTSQVLIGFLMNGGATGQGQINANGASAAAFGSFSDVRLKENVVDLPSQIESICNLRPVEFDYKDGSGHQIGFIAQEVQAIYPDVVGESNGYLTLTDMNKNDARLIKAFQELYDKVKALEVRVAELETA